MSADAVKFLHSMAQSISTMALYKDGHPARERALDQSFELLQRLRQTDPTPRFSFLGGEVVYQSRGVHELKDWDWAARLAGAGIERLEMSSDVMREEYEEFLDMVLGRLAFAAIDTSILDTSVARPERRSSIRFGTIGVRGMSTEQKSDLPTTATIGYNLQEEAEAVRWLHREVQDTATLPLLEAEAVVRSLSVAMHSDSQMIIPLLQLKEFDQYTTTHSTNVAVLAMALAEYLELGAKDVRNYGVAGLLHDLGKVRVPKEILVKPGKLTEQERDVMRLHPEDGARIILQRESKLDLAATVAYEHHIMLNGTGYPHLHYHRDCHHASHLVHICDFYDALRTNRPYRGAWESEKVLTYIENGIGREFEETAARAFVAMMRKWGSRSVEVDETTDIKVGEAAKPVEGEKAGG
ncbi:MAG TPA: HD domain-containing phosphohydrolase [Gemmatimonadales bacterium]|nr:HD domain-containing phosphohydrolase [Gemmatimonadales bacterium]